MIIEFVYYDGKYPNLCHGNLILEIDGEIRELHDCLISGGSSYMDGYMDIHCKRAKWKVSNLPDDLSSQEVKECVENLVNENIPFGCCGGCDSTLEIETYTSNDVEIKVRFGSLDEMIIISINGDTYTLYNIDYLQSKEIDSTKDLPLYAVKCGIPRSNKNTCIFIYNLPDKISHNRTVIQEAIMSYIRSSRCEYEDKYFSKYIRYID